VRESEDPTNFDAFLRLDGMLAPRRQFARIVRHWDRYLAAKPDDARAYYERGGARRHAGDVANSIVDLDRACTMGLQKACPVAEYVRRRGKPR
jgi:hypothetical protein